MSQAEDLLNSIQADNEISLYTSDPQTEGYIVVNSNRFITVPEELKRIAVANDHNIETVTFECPRYWDGHDLSLMHFYINYRSPDESLGCYVVDNVSIDENDSNIMHFDWTITRNVAKSEGKVIFLVCAKKVDENGNETLHWNSELCEDMYVSEGLECDEVLEEEYPDLYTQLIEMINNVNTSYPDMYPKIEKLANDTKKVYDDTNLVYNDTKKVYDDTNLVYNNTKKVYDDLDKLGVGNGVVYTPNDYRYINIKDGNTILRNIISNVFLMSNFNGDYINLLGGLYDSDGCPEYTIWQMSNYARIISRIPIDFVSLSDRWTTYHESDMLRRLSLNDNPRKITFRLQRLCDLIGMKINPLTYFNHVPGSCGKVDVDVEFFTGDRNMPKYFGSIKVPSVMNMRNDEAMNVDDFYIYLEDVGDILYRPLHSNEKTDDDYKKPADEICFPRYITIDMTFPCEESGSKVAISELVQNYIEIGATEVSTQNNTMYSGGVE